MKRIIEHHGEKLTFTVVKNRRYKRFVIRPLGNQHYRISAPARANQREINQAIVSNMEDVLALPTYQTIPEQIINTLKMPLFGSMYSIAFSNVEALNKQDVIVIDKKPHESARDALIRYLKPRFLDAIYASLDNTIYKTLNPNLDSMTIKMRYMRSQFGGCIASKNQISLNLDLIHYPKRYLAYVIAHEMVHFCHKNHSKAFYDTLETVWPRWQEDRTMLNSLSRLAHHVSHEHLIDAHMSQTLRRS